VRYVPPRWIWDGTAICAVPSEVSRAMLRAWHANNGVLLGNPRLGFVCTKQTVDGQTGLEGYYYEHDHALAPEERLRFAPGEDSPDFDPAAAPRVDATTWPASRLQKAARNYAMAYVRTILHALVASVGPADAAYLGGVTGRLIGMQFYARTAELLGVAAGGREGFARYLVALGRAQGDDTAAEVEGDEIVVRQSSWRLMGDAPRPPAAVFDAWNELWVGALAVHDRRARLEVRRRRDAGDDAFEWRLRDGDRRSVR
jgi:hypothetical protein